MPLNCLLAFIMSNTGLAMPGPAVRPSCPSGVQCGGGEVRVARLPAVNTTAVFCMRPWRPTGWSGWGTFYSFRKLASPPVRPGPSSESESDGGPPGPRQAGLLQRTRPLRQQDDEDLHVGGRGVGHGQHLPVHPGGGGVPAGPVDRRHSSLRRTGQLRTVEMVLRQVMRVIITRTLGLN